VAPLKIFIYREGLARFATEKFEKPRRKNLTNLMMHLTNYAVNKKSKEF
jgi:tubulin polyglutamylase TTLL6/13